MPESIYTEPVPPARLNLYINAPRYHDEKTLIMRLRWLESTDCRQVMAEQERIMERRIVTEQFKMAISQNHRVRLSEVYSPYE